jgi:signal transduction histidine kinase
MAIGLLVSFAYVYSAAFSLFSRAQLPRPLFTSLAVILSVLLLTPTRRWWLYLGVYYVLQVGLAAWFTTISLPLLAVSNIANLSEPLIDAALFRRFVPQDRSFGQLKVLTIYITCVTVGALLSATWGATSRLLLGSSFWPSFQGWFQSDALASLVLVPTIVIWANTGVRGVFSAPRERLLEGSLLGVALVVSAGLILGAQTNDSEVAPALLYVPIPLLICAAVRFGPRGLLTSLTLVTVMAIVGVANGLGPFEGRSAHPNILTLQFFLFGVGVPLFLLAAAVDDARARARAAAELRTRDELVAVVAHDLKHPLASAMWHLQILRRRLSRDGSVTQEHLAGQLELIEQSIQAMTAQIDELQDATRLQAGRTLDLHLGPTDLVALAHRVVRQFEDPSDRSRFRFETSMPELYGEWDQMRLEPALANLLSNAVKYSPSGSQICIQVARDSRLAVLSVEDHGIGIPPAELPHIFERYRRGSNVAQHRRGSGQGLRCPSHRRTTRWNHQRAQYRGSGDEVRRVPSATRRHAGVAPNAIPDVHGWRQHFAAGQCAYRRCHPVPPGFVGSADTTRNLWAPAAASCRVSLRLGVQPSRPDVLQTSLAPWPTAASHGLVALHRVLADAQRSLDVAIDRQPGCRPEWRSSRGPTPLENPALTITRE